ncbi:uncharacterized protein LOC134229288 [Saccostrea cucullata]|uniref:uncharacterized protein LOC134229288 n=1 Tax=Saccostrea cuccullata TaxID=36930 RepID=UPI002ED089DA
MSVMYRLVLQTSVTVSGVSTCRHISHVSTERVWISDNKGNLILTNTTGVTLDQVTDLYQYSGVGLHTVTRDSAVIYIDRHRNIIKLSKDKVKTTVIPHTAPWRPYSVYSSPSTGDLLVGMFNTDTRTGQVNRYTNTGRHIQTIQHDNTGQGLYSLPRYITENRSGDVIVSDINRGVVVTDRGGRHRFSYRGPTSGSFLGPRGICTDALSHILVCDFNTDTVHIIDQDGLFLTQIETKQHGIDTPWGLSYDYKTQLLWVGSWNNNTVNIYRLINEGDDLTDKVDELKTFLRKEKTTVSHARGILVGCAEAGKTTLLKRLRGQSQNIGEVTESTRGLEVHQHLFIVKDRELEDLRHKTDDDSIDELMGKPYLSPTTRASNVKGAMGGYEEHKTQDYDFYVPGTKDIWDRGDVYTTPKSAYSGVSLGQKTYAVPSTPLGAALPVKKNSGYFPSTNTLGKTVMKPATFDGTGSWIDYKAHFEACSSINLWNDRQKGLYLAASLRGQVQTVLGNMKT